MVLYTINVFITFTISLLGLCSLLVAAARATTTTRARPADRCRVIGFVDLRRHPGRDRWWSSFAEGGWVTLFITVARSSRSALAHPPALRLGYDALHTALDASSSLARPGSLATEPPALDPHGRPRCSWSARTAASACTRCCGCSACSRATSAISSSSTSRTVDAHSYGGAERLAALKTEAQRSLSFFVNFCHSNGLAAKSYLAFGTDPVDELVELCADQVARRLPEQRVLRQQADLRAENWFIRAAAQPDRAGDAAAGCTCTGCRW